MKKTKGIVMRTSPKLTVIFTEKGGFLEIPTPKELPKLGQTIEVIRKPLRIPSFRNSWFKYSTAAVLLLVLSITAFNLFFIPNIAVASVALDINNGIELLVNNQGKVIKVRDVDGTSSILDGISVKGLDVYQTVNLIVENANNKGMFDETQNLVLASVVPINRWGNQMIDTAMLRNTLRDEMILMNLSGSVVVGQTTKNIQQQAQKQGMTVNSYLIYDRCEDKGIPVQPDSFRNNIRKALADANVSIASLFPEESIEVSIPNQKDDSEDTQQQPNEQKAPEHAQSTNIKTNPTENHSYEDNSKAQHQSPGNLNLNDSAEASGSHEVTESSQESSHEPSSETTHDLNETSSGQVSSEHSMPESSSQQQPANPSDNNEAGTVHDQETAHVEGR